MLNIKEKENQPQPFNLKNELFSLEILNKEIEIQQNRAFTELDILQKLEKEKLEKLDFIKENIGGNNSSKIGESTKNSKT